MAEPFGRLTFPRHTLQVALMGTGDRTTTRHTSAEYGRLYPLRPFALAGGLSVVLFSLSAAILLIALRSPATAPRTDPLALYTLCVIIVWCGSVTVMLMRPPDPAQAVLIWGRNANVLIWSLHISVMGMIWGVLPLVSLTEQYYATAFLVAYVPTQIISSPESTTANRGGIILVLGSTILFLATRGAMMATMLAAYIAGFAALLFVLSDKILRTVRATVAQRLASEAAARELDRLLEIVSAERDAKTRFLAAASHDLGQPLQAAALFFDQTLRAPDEDTRSRAIGGVHRAFASAEQLLAHMLNHLRLEADAVEPQLSTIRLPSLVKRIAAQYSPAAAVAGIRVDARAANLSLMADPTLIERALGNLVHNAIVHSHGTLILLIARHHGAHAIRLWVVDDGVGIGRSDARHIFDDYYQGARSLGNHSGFGLGLSSVRQIAALLGGSAGLDSRSRKGSAFYLEFPRGDAAATQGNTR